MKDAWTPYLESLEMSSVVEDALKRGYALAEKISPEEILDVVVTEYLDRDRARIFENAWFLSASYALESKEFLQSQNCDLSVVKGNVSFVEVRTREFDLSVANPGSRIQLRFQTTDGVEAQLRGTGENCKAIANFLFAYLKSNMWSPGS